MNLWYSSKHNRWVLINFADLTWVVADKIRTVLEQPYEIDHYTYHSTCSVDITFFPDKEQQNSVDILQQADAARYETKELSRNTVSFFIPVLDSRQIKPM